MPVYSRFKSIQVTPPTGFATLPDAEPSHFLLLRQFYDDHGGGSLTPFPVFINIAMPPRINRDLPPYPVVRMVTEPCLILARVLQLR